MMASWNHHDTEFNQSNVGNSNIIVLLLICRGGRCKRETRSE